MRNSKMKRVLSLLLVVVMTTAAASTVFARGFGGGRIGQCQGLRILEHCRFEYGEGCRYDCISFDADGNVVFAEGCRRVDAYGNVTCPREGRGLGQRLGICRRLQ